MISLDPKESEASSPPNAGKYNRSWFHSCMTIIIGLFIVSTLGRIALLLIGHFFISKQPPPTRQLFRQHSSSRAPADPKHLSDLETCKKNITSMAEALHLYAADNQGHYPDDPKKLIPIYLSAIPTCPGRGRDTYSSSYQVSRDHYKFTIFCQGQNHISVGVSPDDPAFSSETGLDVNYLR